MSKIFLLSHIHESSYREDKVVCDIGIFATEEAARDVILRLKKKPGFIDTPEGFRIYEYLINKDYFDEPVSIAQ